MRILYDHQMFALQKFGGISRVFIELMKHLAPRPECEISWHRGWHVDGYDTTAFRPALSAYAGSEENPLAAAGTDRAVVNRQLFERFLTEGSPGAGPFDLYHPSYYDAGLLGLPKARRLVLTIPDLIPEKYFGPLERFQTLLQDRRTLIGRADLILAISESTKRDLLELFPEIAAAKVHVTLLASSMGEVQGTETPPEICRQKPFLLYVGTRSKYKNFELLVRAFAARPALADAYNVLCFGGTGELAEGELKPLPAGKARGAFHYLRGGDALLKALYQQAAALVYPSRYEGFGLPPLEAMECGCPVICTASSSLPEVVGEAALFIDPDEPDLLVSQIESLASNADQRAGLVAAGQAQAAKFDWRKTAEATLAAYQTLGAAAEADVPAAVNLSPEQKVSAYWSAKKKYPQSWYAFPPTRDYIFESVSGDPAVSPFLWAQQAFFAGRKFGQVLDVGCGQGQKISGLVKNHLCEHGTGIDIAEGAIVDARMRAREAGLADQLDYQVVDLNQPDALPVDRYDLILCNGSLHHLLNLETAALSIFRALRPGGALLASEFTGPSRYRYSPAQIEAINAGRRLLPDELGGNVPWQPEILFPKLDADPSESIRSEEIGATLTAIFDEVVARPFGGNLLMRALPLAFFASFDDDDPAHRRALAAIIALEKELLAGGEPSHHAYFAAFKHRQPAPGEPEQRLLKHFHATVERLTQEREALWSEVRRWRRN